MNGNDNLCFCTYGYWNDFLILNDRSEIRSINYDEYCFILLNSVSILALNDPIIKVTFQHYLFLLSMTLLETIKRHSIDDNSRDQLGIKYFTEHFNKSSQAVQGKTFLLKTKQKKSEPQMNWNNFQYTLFTASLPQKEENGFPIKCNLYQNTKALVTELE